MQMYITTAKYVAERKKKKKLKSLIQFHNANKIDKYNTGGKKAGRESKECIEQVKK